MKRAMITLLLCIVSITAAHAAEMSPTLPEILAKAGATDQIAVIAFLDHKLSMDDVYPEAKALPMGPRREYVVQVLKERFAQMSPNVMKYLEGNNKSEVSLLRPLWIMNAIRLTATREVIQTLATDYPEVIYVASDPVYENTLDNGWGSIEIGAPQVWAQFGARGQGVIIGHKDSGVNYVGCARFEGRIWTNPGEDLNGNGNIDGDEDNGIDDDGNGYIDDFHGWGFDHNNNDVTDNDPFNQGNHGTRTGSVICSNNINVDDTVSVAPEAQLMLLRGFLTQGAVFESSQYALDKSANVISASLSFKQDECINNGIRECPNRVGHRWVAEMELAAGIIHANSTGNQGCGSSPRPLCVGTPADSPPPAMTNSHYQQGGVSSIVSVAAYNSNGTFDATSRVGPCGWSRTDQCVQPRSPFCGQVGTPSEYPLEFEDYPYYDGSHGLLKPDITAPSTVEAVSGSCGQGSINGTSGATPHVGGALAVIYSAFPGITPEEAYLRLVYGALDAGDAGPDTTWGFGKLRLLSAVAQGMDSLGSAAGIILHQPSDDPIANMRIRVAGAQEVWTDANGHFEIFLRPGTYNGYFEKFGYALLVRELHIVAGEEEDASAGTGFAQEAIAEITVRDESGNPVANASVRHPISGLHAITNNQGQCAFGQMYDDLQEFVIGENLESYETLTIARNFGPGNNTIDTELVRSSIAYPTGHDVYGYFAYDDLDLGGPNNDWVELTDGTGLNLNLTGDNCVTRALPFNMQFYGAQTDEIMISANGHIEVGSPCSEDWSRWPIPQTSSPNNYISVFWQDYRPELGGGVWFYSDTENHRVIVQWDDVPEFFETGRATFQVHIYDPAFYGDHLGNSVIEIHFLEYSGRLETSIGIENADGSDGLQYAFQLQYSDGAAPVRAGRAIRFTTDIIEPVGEEPVATPSEFALLQNYPNPFNSQTTFRFVVPTQSDVVLKLYDIMGRETATLFEGMRSAGEHSVSFDAKGLATGIYFARLEAQGNIVGTRKVLFLK